MKYLAKDLHIVTDKKKRNFKNENGVLFKKKKKFLQHEIKKMLTPRRKKRRY